MKILALFYSSTTVSPSLAASSVSIEEASNFSNFVLQNENMPAPASTITPRHRNVHSNAMTTYNIIYVGQTVLPVRAETIRVRDVESFW